MQDWPYTTFPTGWYQVDWSAELAPGTVKPLHIFDKEVVLYRTEGGEARLVDAFCPHMGAHLGHGGCVNGDNLRCPWHAWEFDGRGRNVAIPFIERLNHRATLSVWPVQEIGGLVLTWYDALGREPSWEWPCVPEFLDAEHFYPPVPHGNHFHGVRRIMPQSVLENAADLYHLPAVHGAGGPGRPLEWEENGHHFRALLGVNFGQGKTGSWLTPNGPTEGTIEAEFWGLGLGVARFCIEGFTVAQVIATTPVNADESMMFSNIAAAREPGDPDEPAGRAARMIAFQHGQIARDFDIWANQRYVARPFYAGEESRWFTPIRRWASQFYPEDAAVELFAAPDAPPVPLNDHQMAGR